MKALLPHPEHASYKRHRREVASQIILPVVLASLFLIALIVLIVYSTFNSGGDVSRWAAISTIWIVIPIMIAMLIFLALLVGIIYLFARLLHITPFYTGLAQDYVHLAANYIKKFADAVAQPVFIFEDIMTRINAFFGRK